MPGTPGGKDTDEDSLSVRRSTFYLPVLRKERASGGSLIGALYVAAPQGSRGWTFGERGSADLSAEAAVRACVWLLRTAVSDRADEVVKMAAAVWMMSHINLDGPEGRSRD